MSALRELQRDLLLDLAGLKERPATDRDLDFLAPEGGTVEDRWHVYAHGYLGRLTEALEADYPAVRRILGAGAFAALSGRYVRAFPPRSFDLGRAGDRLPEHLMLDPVSAGLPFLPDLARLERLVAEAFVAADAEPLAWESLAGEDPEEVAHVPLVLVPGTAVLWSRWPVLAIWQTRRLADEDVAVDLAGRPQSVLVFRRETAVSCSELTAPETEFAEAASEGGLTLSMLAARLASGGGAREIALLLAAFRSLAERGIFARVHNPGGTPIRGAAGI
ncbi:MAG TPA: DNA-binding domain-containing protein [Thermoanaerobaculia bacterium]|nr:DNA-binding domain-containing protein [Thermoanaerobaculia bacterium]